MGIFKKISVANKGLRYKLLIAFSLMSIIPLLASMYIISTYVFPQLESIATVSLVVMASVVIAVLGLFLAKGLVDPVIGMALEARIIAEGEYDRHIPISGDDEIGNLAVSINAMTQKIKVNLDELKGYGQKMRDMNVDIHKKVLALSSLLQIGDAIASGSIQMDSLLELAVEKASSIFDDGFGALYMPKNDGGYFTAKTSHNLDAERLEGLTIKKGEYDIFNKALSEHTVVAIDKGVKVSKNDSELLATYNLKNMLVAPIFSGRKNMGILIFGTRQDDFLYKSDDIELVKVFAKQITIAIENDMLSKKSEELAIKDDLTDLYNKSFIMNRLEEEIKRAIFYQRPCSFIVFNVDNFKEFRQAQGELAAEEALKRMAKIVRDNTSPIGKAARINVDEFAMLLPEKNKREAGLIAEDVRRKIESASLLREGKAPVTVSSGVSENPIDGATADEVFKKAMEALKQAKQSGKNKIVA